MVTQELWYSSFGVNVYAKHKTKQDMKLISMSHNLIITAANISYFRFHAYKLHMWRYTQKGINIHYVNEIYCAYYKE